MQIIIEYGKHGEAFHDASSNEAWAKSSLAILTERFESGYYYYDPGEEPWKPEGYLTGPEILEKFGEDYKTDPYGKVAVKINSDYHRQHKSWKREKVLYDEIKRIVEEKDLSFIQSAHDKKRGWPGCPVAWQMLDDRSDHEYERVELEKVRTH